MPSIRVFRGSATFSGTSTTVAVSPAVADIDHAFVYITSVVQASIGPSSSEDDQRDFTASVDLTDVDEVTITRPASAAGTVTVYFEGWEDESAGSGANAFKVHRGTITVGDTYEDNTVSVTLDDTARPHLHIPSGVKSTSTGSTEGTGFLCLHGGGQSGPGSAELERDSNNAAGALSQPFQVVEWTGENWNLFRAEDYAAYSPAYVYDGVSKTTAVDWSKALIWSTKKVIGGADYAEDANDLGWAVRPASAGGYDAVYLDVDNAVYGYGYHKVRAYVLQNDDADFFSVARMDSIAGGASNLSAATTHNVTISAVADLDRTGALVTAWTNSTANDLRPGLHSWALTSTTNLAIIRATATGDGEFAAQIFEFAPDATVEVTAPASATAAVGSPILDPPAVTVSSACMASASVPAPTVGAEPTYRDTVYYASGTISTDLSQYQTNITASGGGAYETSSARANITGERNVYYRGDLSTGDSEKVLVWHGLSAWATNTWSLVVRTGGAMVAVYHGSTKLLEVDLAGASGSDQDYSIGWSTRANPDTTGASDAQISEVWTLNHDTGAVRIGVAAHAVPSGSASRTFSVGGWWDGATMQAAPANAPVAVRVGTTYYSHVQYAEDFGGSTPWSSEYQSVRPSFVIAKSSGLGSDGQWYGPEAQYVARMIADSRMRLASPLVNEIYRDAETIYRSGAGLHIPDERWIYAPDSGVYQLGASLLRWVPVPLLYSRVRVRVNVTSFPASGGAVPIGLCCYSMSHAPPSPSTWRRTPPVVASYTHTTRADREWVDLGELEIVRWTQMISSAAQREAYTDTTHLALGIAIDPAGASSNDNNARVYINAWHVYPVGSKGAGYSGPETPPNQQLQPQAIGLPANKIFG